MLDFCTVIRNTAMRMERGGDLARVNRIGENGRSDEDRSSRTVEIGGWGSAELIRSGKLCVRVERDTISRWRDGLRRLNPSAVTDRSGRLLWVRLLEGSVVRVRVGEGGIGSGRRLAGDRGARFTEEPWDLAGLRRVSRLGGRFGRRTGGIVKARCLATKDGTAGDVDPRWMRRFVLLILILGLVLILVFLLLLLTALTILVLVLIFLILLILLLFLILILLFILTLLVLALLVLALLVLTLVLLILVLIFLILILLLPSVLILLILLLVLILLFLLSLILLLVLMFLVLIPALVLIFLLLLLLLRRSLFVRTAHRDVGVLR